MCTRPWAQPAQPANLLHFDLVSWPQRVLPAPPTPPSPPSAVLVPAQAQAPWQPWGHQPLLYGGCRRAELQLPTALPGPNIAPAQPGLPTAQPSLSTSLPPVPGAGAALVPWSWWGAGMSPAWPHPETPRVPGDSRFSERSALESMYIIFTNMGGSLKTLYSF